MKAPRLKPGDRVEHPEWGYGTIYLKSVQMGYYIVDFDDNGCGRYRRSELTKIDNAQPQPNK